jgi:hypothetical protein
MVYMCGSMSQRQQLSKMAGVLIMKGACDFDHEGSANHETQIDGAYGTIE